MLDGKQWSTLLDTKVGDLLNHPLGERLSTRLLGAQCSNGSQRSAMLYTEG